MLCKLFRRRLYREAMTCSAQPAMLQLPVRSTSMTAGRQTCEPAVVSASAGCWSDSCASMLMRSGSYSLRRNPWMTCVACVDVCVVRSERSQVATPCFCVFDRANRRVQCSSRVVAKPCCPHRALRGPRIEGRINQSSDWRRCAGVSAMMASNAALPRVRLQKPRLNGAWAEIACLLARR